MLYMSLIKRSKRSFLRHRRYGQTIILISQIAMKPAKICKSTFNTPALSRFYIVQDIRRLENIGWYSFAK